MTTIHADQLQPGDVVVYDGNQRQITHVERRRGWAWPIAADGSGWAIALGHQLIEVHRNALETVADVVDIVLTTRLLASG